MAKKQKVNLKDTLNRINADIKNGTFANAYLLYGSESYLMRQYRDKLVAALINPDDTMNLSRFQGAGIDSNELINLSETLPFFADRRVIVVEDSGFFKSSEAKLAEYISNCPETSFFIFVEKEVNSANKMFKAVSEIGYAGEFVKPDEAQLAGWAGAKLKAASLQISREAWQEFMIRVNSTDDANMENMDRELEKLIDYCLGKDAIEKEDVEAICSGHVEAKIYELMDAVVGQNITRAMELYRSMLQMKEAPLRILTSMENEFRNLLAIRTMVDEHMDLPSMSKQLSMQEWQIRKKLQIASRMPIDRMEEVLNTCLDYEERIKTGRLADNVAVEMLIMKYGK